MALSGRAFAVALLAVLAVLAVRSAVTIAVVDGLLLAAVAADVLLAVPVGQLRLTRSGDTRVRLGEQATVTTTVVNTGRRPLHAQARDAWPPSARASPYRTPLNIPPGGAGNLVMTVSPERHGDCEAGRVTIRSFGPLGLAARQRSQSLPWTVRALPPFPSRKHLPGKLAHLRELDGQHRAALPGAGSEFDALREYVIGDDVRSIDWRSTARRGEVLVRTWRPERDRRIVFLLDTGRTAAGRVAGYPRLDAAMDAVQLLTALASQAGDRIDLIGVDQRIRTQVLAPPRTTALATVTEAMAALSGVDQRIRTQVLAPPRTTALATVTEAMAALRPELAETDWRLAPATVLPLARRRCLVVLLTDLNPTLALPELGALLARHELLIGAVADPRIAELAAGRGDAASVYSAAAAMHFAEERARLTAQLNRLGATVVDAPPDRIAPALADAYLMLKSRGRL